VGIYIKQTWREWASESFISMIDVPRLTAMQASTRHNVPRPLPGAVPTNDIP